MLEAEWRGADVSFCTLRVIKKLTSLTRDELDPPLLDPLPLTTGVKRAFLPSTSASTSVLRAFVLAYLIKAGNAFYQTRKNADEKDCLVFRHFQSEVGVCMSIGSEKEGHLFLPRAIEKTRCSLLQVHVRNMVTRCFPEVMDQFVVRWILLS